MPPRIARGFAWFTLCTPVFFRKLFLEILLLSFLRRIYAAPYVFGFMTHDGVSVGLITTRK